MRHRLLLLNLLLAGLTGAAGWRLRQDWLRDHQHADKILQARVKPAAAPTVVPVAAPVPFTAPAFADVAQKDLFSKDRNPNVVVEPVAVKPKPKWPAMPVVFGVMGLPEGMVVMLAERPDTRTRGARVGDRVGEMKLVALSPEKISFEFEGEVQERNIQDLVQRGGREEPNSAATSMNPANIAAQRAGAPPPLPKPGTDIGAQMKACDPRDTSPAGTVVDGFKKIVERTPFGDACRWIPAQ